MLGVECLAHGMLGLFPAQTRVGLEAVPAIAQVAFQMVVPLAAGVLLACLHAVAIRRAIIVVRIVGIAITCAVEATFVMRVAIAIHAVRAIGALPGIACSQTCVVPLQTRFATITWPLAGQGRFGFFPGAGRTRFACLQTEPVNRCVIAIVIGAFLVVRTVLMFLAPVFGFDGRVQAFRHALAGRSASHNTDCRTDQGA
ncbi:hypothetical protein XGA_2670 [Xanthomonas hortorum ATCC 19865]|nr:hypothetical protein XGA_2670 [Xanthomonas hortorum ATCC 19865]